MKIVALSLCLYFCPQLFKKLSTRWFPDEFIGTLKAQNEANANLLRRRFWRSFAVVAAAIGGVLLFQSVRRGGLGFNVGDWIRIFAVLIALTAALGRSGWDIQTWEGKSVNERIDRSMYFVGQLGAAALLVFALTL